MDKIIRIGELVKQLNQWRHEYYNKNESSVDDSKYDKYFDELTNLEIETGCILSNSPTQEVGYTVMSKLQKVTHLKPLLSLSKTQNIDDVVKFCGDKKYLLMLKLDGLTVKLEYENGELIQGSTRGSGTQGEDITTNCKVFKNLPLTIPYKGKLTIVGEAIIHINDLIKINSTLPEDQQYKNTRNLASGSVRQLDSSVCAERYVYFYSFGILESDKELSDSKFDNFAWLESLGFWTVIRIKLQNLNSEELFEMIDNMRFVANEKHIGIDGCVVSFDSVSYSDSLKVTSHHPLHSFAFKFLEDSVESILLEIEWSVGKTGVITPVGIIEPVELGGSTVSRANLHNLSVMEELELGIGDTVNIIKAKEIIPQITDNQTRSNSIIIPDSCPVCGAKTDIKQDNNSKVLICTNDNCSAKFLKKLAHFVSRDAMNIDGVSESILEKLIDEGFIKSYADIFRLEQYADSIIALDGFGKKSYTNMIEAINTAKNTEMHRVIYAMSIPNIGRTASKAIAKHFDYQIDKFISALLKVYDFTILEDFGDIMNSSIHTWWRENYVILNNVLRMVNIKKPVVNKESNGLKDLSGLTFVVTGTVESFQNRKELEDLILSLSGKLSSGVSSKTNYLINNDLHSPSSKNQKALSLNIPIILEEEFNEMIGRQHVIITSYNDI